MVIRRQVLLVSIATALVVFGTSCEKSQVAEPNVSADSVDAKVRKWRVAFAKAEALGGWAFVELSKSDTEFLVRAAPKPPSPEIGVMARGPDPICETTTDEGLDGLEEFADCARQASEDDVCGNGGETFMLEINKDEGSIHLHCPKKK